MSEQQVATATRPGAYRNEPDTSEPSPERKAELGASGKPPYEGVKLRTRGEVEWIMRERRWSTADANPDISEAANPSGATHDHANFIGADLRQVNLSGINLSGANLSNARFFQADLRDANLFRANLSGASLYGAQLEGADLREVRMDPATTLTGAKLDCRTRLADVRWNGGPLTRVDWSLAPRLGDDTAASRIKGRWARITACRDAARAYRGLSVALRGQGLLIPASGYRLREQVLERKAKFLEFSLLGWTFSWLLNLIAGYGERPVRAFFAYLLVLFGFAGVYFALGTGQLGILGLGTHDAITSPLSALVFSVTSFHGRGFFPGRLSLDDPITALAALEAVIGLFIEITFIATFTQRFFAR